MKSQIHTTRPTPPASNQTAADSGMRPAAVEWVLVLDDDVLAGRALARIVRTVTGLEVQIARSIEQAESLMRRLPAPSAVVTDFELISEDGAMAVEGLRQFGCQAPAVVVTGSPERAMVTLADSSLSEVVPVIAKSEAHERLPEWLDQVQLCWMVDTKVPA